LNLGTHRRAPRPEGPTARVETFSDQASAPVVQRSFTRKVIDAAGVRFARLRRWPRTPALLAFAAYLGLALIVTWPWVTSPGSIFYGIQGGDLTASVAQFQQFANAHHAPFLPGTIHALNAPEGLRTTWALYVAALGSTVSLWLLSMAFGAVAAHGLLAVSGFALSAFAMFLLARKITGRLGPALIAGLAFGFWPFQYGTAWTWPHYTQLWVLVLLTWRMLELSEKPTVRNGLLAGAAAVFAMTWIQYHLLIAAVLFATLGVFALLRSWRTGTVRRQVSALSVACAMVVAAGLFVALAGAADQFSGEPQRTADESVQQSARPLMYLVPGPQHPLLGHVTGDWVLHKYANPALDPSSTAAYADIYLGVPLMLLALGGVILTADRVRRRRSLALTEQPAAAGLMALLVGVVGLLFSAPPRVQKFGLTIPLPYDLVEHVTPVFRVAHRFAILAMLAACLLAAIALSKLVGRLPRRTATVVLALVALVIGVDLWARPVPSWTRLGHPAIYDIVKRQPPGILAEYPLDDTYYGQNLGSLYETMHRHPLFIGFDPASVSGSKKLELKYLLEKRTVPDLAAYGVKLVLVRNQPNREAWMPGPGQAIPGLRMITSDSFGTLYRVVAPPARTTSYALTGFNAPEGNPPGVVRWLAANGGTIELRSDCALCDGTVSFHSGSFAYPRRLTIQDGSGRVLYQRLISGAAQTVSFPVRFSHSLLMRFSTDPPPVAVNAVQGGPDTRRLGIYVGQPVRFYKR
jgi:hypothetical protein